MIASSAGLCAGVSFFPPMQFHSSDDDKTLQGYSLYMVPYIQLQNNWNGSVSSGTDRLGCCCVNRV